MNRKPLVEITVGEQLAITAAAFPEREALVFGDRRWTYRELDALTDLYAAGLLSWGMRRGDVLGIWCEAQPETVFLLYAALKVGIIAAMINTSLQEEEAEDILRRSDVRYLAIGRGYKNVDYAAVCRSLPKLPKLEKIFAMDGDRHTDMEDLSMLAEAGRTVPADVLLAARAAVRPRDTATMLYTSGTTSRPKIVLDTHYSRMNMGIQQAIDLRTTEQDRFCVAMPLFHCFCMSVNTMAAMSSGACLVLCEDRHTATIARAVMKERCTVLSCVPALYHAIISRPDFRQEDFATLRTGYIGGSLYPPSMFRLIEEKLGFTLMSSLGQTESTAGVTTCEFDDPLDVRADTVGHFLTYLEGKAVDIQNGRTQPAGASGELCVRGYSVMQGYYGAPESTKQAIDAEGWLHTGDMGFLDEKGYIHLTGRLKDLIIRGGENISPAEIEAAVSADARVEDSRAVGVPDDHYGEEVCLCVQLKPGESCTETELREMLRGMLAHYKVPRYIRFVEEFPRTTTGKIRTGELAACMRARLEAEKKEDG